MEIAYDCSSVDYPLCVPGEIGIPPEERTKWVGRTWGEDGIGRMLDTILATGSRRVHFRSHCAGPWWPTGIAGARPGKVGRLLDPPFEDWNPVARAVELAHSREMKIIGWFDLTEGHAGYPTEFALRHPHLCIVDRGGSRLDGPTGLTGRGGEPFDPEKHISYRDLIDGGFMDEECERPDGTTIDPHLSLAYPEVVEYRLDLLRELLSFGVDGIFMTANSCVGYEDPVVASFEEEHGIDPRRVPEDDDRWISHQRDYFTEFMRRVAQLLDEEERKSGRNLELILEGQGSGEGSQEPEVGGSNLHRWAAHAMVILVMMHMLRVFLTSSYKPPREFNWVIGVMLLVLTLLLSFTGYLLPWDQLAFWAVTVGTRMGGATPFVGAEGPFHALLGIRPDNDVRYLLLGDTVVGENALLRFYVLHCILLPLAATVLMFVHFWRVRKDGGISHPL